MKLGYTIVYVPSVEAALKFFTEAFGFSVKFAHDSGMYGELETGETTLAFAAHELGIHNFPGGHVAASDSEKPLGMEVAFVTQDVEAAHSHALRCGARQLAAPSQKPWGQQVSYVRSPEGILTELCSAVQK